MSEPTSKRGYLDQDELEQFADITITDSTEADDQISQAEELIDDYVGPQPKFMNQRLEGLISAGGSTSFTLEDTHQNTMQQDYLKGCWVEIIGGTGIGQRRKITGQTYAGVITVQSAFSPVVDTTSFYRIWQLGKFPRGCDVSQDSRHSPIKYYKLIPEKIRRATAAQVEYMINMGASFFGTDQADYQSERIGDYGYSKGSGQSGIANLIAPKAKILLRGLINRKGVIVD